MRGGGNDLTRKKDVRMEGKRTVGARNERRNEEKREVKGRKGKRDKVCKGKARTKGQGKDRGHRRKDKRIKK